MMYGECEVTSLDPFFPGAECIDAVESSAGRRKPMTSTDSQPAAPPPQPPRIQFSLRTLFLLTTILAVALSLLKWLYIEWGLDIVGLVILVAVTMSFHLGCALWMIDDARKRGKSSLLLVALFAYAGPLGLIPWLVLRLSIGAVARSTDIQARTEKREQEGTQRSDTSSRPT